MVETGLRKKLSLLCWMKGGAAGTRRPATMLYRESGGPLPAQVLPMPAENPDLAAAAATYAQHLAAADGQPLSSCLIGIGEDGHFASLFPEHPGLDELDPVFVRQPLKPPALRLSMSLAVIRAATSKEVL